MDRPGLPSEPTRKPVDGTRRALVVGTGDTGRELAQSLELSGRCRVVGFIDDGSSPATDIGGWPIVGHHRDIHRLLDELAIDEVFVAFEPTWQQQLLADIAIHSPSVRLNAVPTPYEALMNTNRVMSDGDIAFLPVGIEPSRRQQMAKRVIDIAASAFGLLLLSPFLLLVTLLTKLISPGPSIFAQERVGRNGVLFTCYKFRTMVHNAENETGPTLANGRHDPRQTSIGRWLRLFRIDEIPQLWNVLRGDMSLVGPRPERPYFVEKYNQGIPSYELRHRVRPGITGLAQVLGGYHTEAHDKLRFDLLYASHASLCLDLKILIKTLLVVILPKRYNWGRREG